MKLTALFITISTALISASTWATPAPIDPIVDLSAIDSSVDPCQDFYHYACGSWIKNFELPADQSSYNRQSDGLSDNSVILINSILQGYAKDEAPAASQNTQKLGALYASCMNTKQIEDESADFIKNQFATIDAIQNDEELAQTIARLQFAGINVLFGFDSMRDMNNSSQIIAQISQDGMSFSDRGYYFKTDPKSIEILARFNTHVKNMFTLAGIPPEQAALYSTTVLRIETAIAQKAKAIEDMQDSAQLNHPMTTEMIQSLAPHFNWKIFFETLGLTENQLAKTNVENPDFINGLDELLTSSDLADLKVFLKWKILTNYAPHLAENFVNENFQFWSSYIKGQKENRPRWKFCTALVSSSMRDAVAQAYIHSFTNPDEIKSNAEQMIQQIKAAFGANLDTLDWLDDSTRQAAHQKLSQIANKVGFPEHWQNFDDLKIVPVSWISNTQAIARFEAQLELNKIGKPTDRTHWGMPPWEVNAYYSPSLNEMAFPIGALVPPIFDLSASWGANFGSVGASWMGHELTHGFDSDGRQFDGNGNLVNWWSQKTLDQFAERSQCLIDQANQYEILPGLMVNGKQTLTENLADQGGVKIGYQALETQLAEKASSTVLGSFNERQQFWLAYAQSWCTKQSDESIRLKVATNSHPPAEFRVNAVFLNRPEFAADFSCKAGSRMAPTQRCSVW